MQKESLMFVNIDEIGAQGLELSNRAMMDGNLLIEDDSYFLEEVDYVIHLARDGEKIRARGRVQTRLSIRCVRCLENFELEVDSTFDIILLPVRMIDEHQKSLNPDEMEYIFFDGKEIDLTRILVEQVNLFIPISPTCGAYCKGICPRCGANLNYENCQCEGPANEMSLLFAKIKR
jgi:uncharacterized protein